MCNELLLIKEVYLKGKKCNNEYGKQRWQLSTQTRIYMYVYINHGINEHASRLVHYVFCRN